MDKVIKAKVVAVASGGPFGSGVYELRVKFEKDNHSGRVLMIAKHILKTKAGGVRGFSVTKVNEYLKTQEGLDFITEFITKED